MSYSGCYRPHTQPQYEPWGGGRTGARSLFNLATEPSLEPYRWDTDRFGRHPTNTISFRKTSNKMSSVSNYPLMDTLNSAMFRLSMEDLVSHKELGLF